MPKWMSTHFSIVTRGGNAKNSCTSAIDAAGYISREELYCEYDGNTYKPDPKEKLVHSEINLPENAPEECKDRATLWNLVEAIEKQHNSQLCRTFKASLPNAWTYEVAEEAVRKYIMDNFVSKGMCADWAIHDSVNEKGQRNLHFHLVLTLRAIDENGKWMPKQKKIYILDKDGNKIRTKKGYKSKTEKTTDWDDPSKMKIPRYFPSWIRLLEITTPYRWKSVFRPFGNRPYNEFKHQFWCKFIIRRSQLWPSIVRY